MLYSLHTHTHSFRTIFMSKFTETHCFLKHKIVSVCTLHELEWRVQKEVIMTSLLNLRETFWPFLSRGRTTKWTNLSTLTSTLEMNWNGRKCRCNVCGFFVDVRYRFTKIAKWMMMTTMATTNEKTTTTNYRSKMYRPECYEFYIYARVNCMEWFRHRKSRRNKLR